MSRTELAPTQHEVFFDPGAIIVSKTDLRGRITYANDVFLDIAGFRESEVLGQPHSILRHPDMPRTVFHLLWQHIEAGREIFAYVKNMTKAGDHYWVLAHVTPSRGEDGATIGYHSNRRAPGREAVAAAEALYREVLAVEQAAGDRRQGLQAGIRLLQDKLTALGRSYDELVFSF